MAKLKAELAGWPASQIEFRPITTLKPRVDNPNTHPQAQVDQIARSMGEWGWTIPVLIDEDGGIIAGHGRVLAAQQVGIDEVPVMVARGWSDAKKRAYVIADNQLTRNSEWDIPLLSGQFKLLQADGFDLSLTGFEDVKIVEFMTGLGDGAAGGPPIDPGKMLAERFGVPPFSVLNAREGWWQDRKRAWIALGIQSELGRGEMGTNTPHEGKGMAAGLVAVRAKQKRANAIPGGAKLPLDRPPNKRFAVKGSNAKAPRPKKARKSVQPGHHAGRG